MSASAWVWLCVAVYIVGVAILVRRSNKRP